MKFSQDCFLESNIKNRAFNLFRLFPSTTIPTSFKLDLDLGPLIQLINQFYQLFSSISNPATHCTYQGRYTNIRYEI